MFRLYDFCLIAYQLLWVIFVGIYDLQASSLYVNIFQWYLMYSILCIIVTFDPFVNQETGASARRLTAWIRFICGAHKKQVDVKQLYNWVTQTAWVSYSQLVGVRVAVRGSENQLSAEVLGPQDPRLSSPAEWERSAAKDRGTWGQYDEVCFVSNSHLTRNPFATLSQPFRNLFE